MYALDVIFYATGGETWTDEAHFLSNMSVCHWNERDEDDYDYYSYSGVGTDCTDGNSEVNTFIFDKFLKNEEPWRNSCNILRNTVTYFNLFISPPNNIPVNNQLTESLPDELRPQKN